MNQFRRTFAALALCFVACGDDGAHDHSDVNDVTVGQGSSSNTTIIAGGSSSTTIVGGGPLTNEPRSVEPFTSVSISSSIEATLRVGPQAVTASAEANVLPHLLTKVEGQTLDISMEPNIAYQNVRPSVGITIPALDRVEVSNSAKVTGELNAAAPTISASKSSEVDLKVTATNGVTVDAATSSTIALSGVASDLHVTASTSATFTSTLRPASATVDASGSSHVEIFASSEVHIKATTSAQVVVHGNPAIRDVHTATSGEVSFED